MDFVERIFHIAPDGGNGTLELALMSLIFLVIVVALGMKRARSPRREPLRGRPSIS